MKKIVLKRGLEYSHLEEYFKYLTLFQERKIDSSKRKIEICELSKRLDELYVLLESIRDQSLAEEYKISYDEVFKQSIEVSMPVDASLFGLQKQYYDALMDLYAFKWYGVLWLFLQYYTFALVLVITKSNSME